MGLFNSRGCKQDAQKQVTLMERNQSVTMLAVAVFFVPPDEISLDNPGCP